MNLRGRKLILAAILLIVVINYSHPQDVPTDIEESQRNQEAVLKYLGPILKGRGGVARIDCMTVCATKSGTPLPFPRVLVQTLTKEKLGLAAVREIFIHDKSVSVSESQSGMIRITIGQPNSAILQTRIQSLSLDREQQYQAVHAIDSIVGCKEVQAAMGQLGFDEPLTVESLGVSPFNKRAPHLPSRLRNMTMDQALDKVAKTFGGIVIYEECVMGNGKRLFSIDFTKTP